MNLKIHSIESFGTVDGPGVRFVIFTQGCPLRCKYCHNPDTWNTQIGKTIDLEDILEQYDDLCVFMSSGGITISGGEPLLQAKALIPLFQKLEEWETHTCIDTSGYMPINNDIEELLKLTDLVLLDIKAVNDDLHKEITGVSNKNTFIFLDYLQKQNIKVRIRRVVLPSINDSKEEHKLLKKLIHKYNNIEKVEVLPFHKLGAYKWENLGMEFQYKDITEPSKEYIKELKTYFKTK